MKKSVIILFAVLILALCMCSCSKKASVENVKIVTKDDILRNNIKTNLVDKYGAVHEIKTYIYTDGKKAHSWHLYYEKTAKSYNAAVIDGDYECYYSNDEVFFTQKEYVDMAGNKEYRKLINLNEEYDHIVDSLLVDDSILKGVFLSNEEVKELEDGGYIATFDFIANPKIAEDFAPWGIAENQKMSVTYTLNKDYETTDIKYFQCSDDVKTLIAEEKYIYGEKTEVPQKVADMQKSEDKVSVKVIQNYGKANERETEYSVMRGSRIYGNDVLMRSKVMEDISSETMFDFESYINEDKVLYVTSYR